MRLLITGGAGFIGKHLCRKLHVDKSFKISVVDNFLNQVHDKDSKQSFIDEFPKIRLIDSDVLDTKNYLKELLDADVLIHLASETGTGQSMYEVSRYFSTNVQATAKIIESIVNNEHNLKKIILSSSRSIYGEGAYFCRDHGVVFPDQRSLDDLKEGRYELFCPDCSKTIDPIPTEESAPSKFISFYANTKGVQEDSLMLLCKNYEIDFFGLRFQNVFGPGQSLANPYTGILAIFTNLARDNKPISIFEDGKESRDFVYIDDVVESLYKSILFREPFIGQINIGTGNQTTVLDIAKTIKDILNSRSKIKITGQFRVGDIRHNFANIESMKKILGVHPKTDFRTGIQHFLKWALQEDLEDSEFYLQSLEEIEARNLLIKTK